MAADQWYLDGPSEKEHIRGGAALMYGGYVLPALFGSFPSVQLYLKKV